MPQSNKTSEHSASGLFDTLRTGLSVLGDELKWICIKALRSIEIRQMEKRLEKEYTALGKAMHSELSSKKTSDAEATQAVAISTDMTLCLKQIEFLQEEIAFLRKECSKKRESLVSERISKMNS